MVYGIGAKALGQQLGESEEDAASFMDSFKMQYKGKMLTIHELIQISIGIGTGISLFHSYRGPQDKLQECYMIKNKKYIQMEVKAKNERKPWSSHYNINNQTNVH